MLAGRQGFVLGVLILGRRRNMAPIVQGAKRARLVRR
jgi:hypothetical protein